MNTSCYALTLPGMESIAAEEIEQRLAAEIKRTASGVVVFRPPEIDRRVLRLLTTEDVFLFAWGTDKLTYRALDLEHLRRWTSREADWTELLRLHHSIRPKPKGKPTWRLVVQMEGHHAYRRKDAAEAVAKGLAGKLPASWRHVDDNASVEIWVTIDEATAVCGLRLSDRTMRHRPYKIEHLPASLRPSLAAGMVRLADIRPGNVVLDPMCGAGTLLCESVLFGKLLRTNSDTPLSILGGDTDASAVRAANVNLRQLGSNVVNRWDARDLPLEDDSIDRIVCNLPFGKQIAAAEEIGPLYDRVLPEFDRVLRKKGRAVLLTSNVPAARRACRAVNWTQNQSVTVRVLGQKATLLAWQKP